MSADATPAGSARYVFAVEFRLEPEAADLSLSPAQFRTTLYRRADPPGEPGWLFFRDHLWRGELTDPAHFRTVTEDAMGVPVATVTFRELQADEAYLRSLRTAIDASPDEFRSADVERVLTNYLGSSIRVRHGDEATEP